MAPLRSTTDAERDADEVAPDVCFDEARAAALISVNRRTLAQWRFRGVGPKFVKISSRCVRYRRSDLLEWVEQRLRTSTSEI